MEPFKKNILIGVMILMLISCKSTKPLSFKDYKNLEKDGLTIENAIKVNNVSEEYHFIRKYCINSKFRGNLYKNTKERCTMF